MGEIPKYARFAMGGSAGMIATSCVQPLDLVKTRMQLAGIGGAAKQSTFGTLIGVVKKEGVF